MSPVDVSKSTASRTVSKKLNALNGTVLPEDDAATGQSLKALQPLLGEMIGRFTFQFIPKLVNTLGNLANGQLLGPHAQGLSPNQGNVTYQERPYGRSSYRSRCT